MATYVVLPKFLRRRDIGVSYGRGTLGVQHGREEGCSTCGAVGRDKPERSMESGIPAHTYVRPAQQGVNITRINIDGIWSYLCDDCFQTLWMLHQGEDISSRLLNEEGN